MTHHVRVESAGDMSWRLVHADGEEIAAASAWVRPDGRCTLTISSAAHDAIAMIVPAVAAATPEEILVNVRAGRADLRDQYAAAGFMEKRTEAVYAIGVEEAVRRSEGARLPSGVSAVPLSSVQEDELRVLDDALRQDVPGADGWRWPPSDFREETYGAWFEPALYLVAVEDATSAPIGIARVAIHAGRPPRLGFIGTSRPYRRTGVASALLARIFAELSRRDVELITTEADVENVASTTLLTSLGAERVGGFVVMALPSRAPTSAGTDDG